MTNTAKKWMKWKKKKELSRETVCDKASLHKAPESQWGNESKQNDTGLCPIGSAISRI